MKKPPPTPTDREHDRARTDRIIAERFQSSSMSDAKWVRLLRALSAHDGLVDECRVKLVWDDDVRSLRIDGTQYELDYWPHAMEAMISGAPRGWYDYKEIEWVEFPPTNHDLARIAAVIDAVGRFDLESSDRGLKLSAYR